MLQTVAIHRARDCSGATVGIMNFASNVGTILRKHNLGSAKVVAAGPPFPIQRSGRAARYARCSFWFGSGGGGLGGRGLGGRGGLARRLVRRVGSFPASGLRRGRSDE